MSEIVFKTLEHHCFELAYIFFELRHKFKHALLQHKASEWLNIAAGIEDVRFDSRKLYDRASGGNIDIDHQLYENSRLKNNDLVFALLRFEMIWNGLTSITDLLAPGEGSHLSRLNAYMSKYYAEFKNLDGYNDSVRKLNRMIRVNKIKIKRSGQLMHRSLKGISLVAAIRSLFVNCAYAFPFSHHAQLDEGTDPDLVNRSSRIVLMTMQMFVLTLFAGQEDRIASWWHADRKSRVGTIHAMLRTVHLMGATG